MLMEWRYLRRRLGVLVRTRFFSDLAKAVPYSSLLLFVRFYRLLLVALYSRSLEIVLDAHLEAVANIEFSAVGSELTQLKPLKVLLLVVRPVSLLDVGRVPRELGVLGGGGCDRRLMPHVLRALLVRAIFKIWLGLD